MAFVNIEAIPGKEIDETQSLTCVPVESGAVRRGEPLTFRNKVDEEVIVVLRILDDSDATLSDVFEQTGPFLIAPGGQVRVNVRGDARRVDRSEWGIVATSGVFANWKGGGGQPTGGNGD